SVFFVVAAVQVSCGGQQTPVAPSKSVTIQSLSVTLATVSGEYQGTAVAALSDGSTKDVTDTASWVSSNTGVATVSAVGRISTVNNGDTDIRATYFESAGHVHLVVTNRPATTSPPSPAPEPDPAPAPAPVPAPTPLYRLTGTLRDGLDQRPIEGADVSAS